MKPINKFFKKSAPAIPVEVIDNEFVDNTGSPMSGGNLFEIEMKLKAQESIDKGSILTSAKELKKVQKAIDEILEKYFKERIYQPYYLLQMQANYFCNTLKFNSTNVQLSGDIIDVIRNAFINGKSGLYFSEALGETFPINIASITYNNYNRVTEITYNSISSGLGNKSADDNAKNQMNTISGEEECAKVAIFKWGSQSYSAWIMIWPFVLQQSDLLKMLAIERFTFSKKFAYSIKNTNAVLNEMEMFFNSNNPFMITTGLAGDFQNKFSILEFNSTDKTQSLILHYNEIMNIYYRMLGRRENDDFKKERNITAEIDASQEQYYAVQNEYINQFKLFIGRCKVIEPSINLSLDEREQKDETPLGGKDDI